MAAVRFQARVHGGRLPLAAAPAAEAPAAGRSTPCTQSGGRAGDPCAGPAGPGLHLAGGGVWAARRLHVLGGLRSHGPGGPGGPGSSGKGRGTWPLERDASCLKRGVRASCFTHRLEMGHEPTEPRFLPGGWVT